ncbi:MAG: hypothetical protein II076_08275 [Bacteroidales bacterium]|nr:hypothetical protein [Bacteroidales bacterium]
MKRTLIIIVAVVAMLAGVTTAKAQTQNTPEDIMSKFFAMFNNDVNQAIDYLFSTNEWLEANKDGTTAMKEKFEASRKLLGNFNGYELAGKYYLGESYAKYVYVLKYDRQPVEFVVTMYRPDKVWKLQNMNFHSDFEKDMIRVD